MPYRRLPNTDQARLRALKNAVQRAVEAEYTDRAINFHTQQEAERFALQFETQVTRSLDNYDTKVKENKQHRRAVQNARMYISHFIQVLNMSVIRGEIKKEQKELYGLSTTVHTVPDLSTDEDLLLWGQRIIDGELKRTQNGGFPIYNPAINKVKVHYDIFKEQATNRSFIAKTTDRVQTGLEEMRIKADQLILDIWNQVENHYTDLLPYDRLRHCQAYGVVYYYRPGEKHLSYETDKKIEEANKRQTTIQWT